MKQVKIFIILLLACWSLQAEAQQVTYRKETIYLDGQPYAFLLKKGSSWAKDFSFQTLNNQELMTAKAVSKELGDGYDYVYYEIRFKGFSQKAEMEDENDVARRLAYDLGNFKVLANGELNLEGVEQFLAKYPDRISKKLAKPTPQKQTLKEPVPPADAANAVTNTGNIQKPEVKNEVMLKAEPSKPVLPLPGTQTSVSASQEIPKEKTTPAPVATSSPATTLPAANIAIMAGLKFSGNKILRGNRQVGMFKVNEKVVAGQLQKTYTFTNLQSGKVAEATFSGPRSTTCRVYTAKDKMTYDLPVRNDENALKVLSSWLLQNKYL